MTHVYVTTITDEAGNVVTGNFNNSDITSRSTSNIDGQYTGVNNPTLNFKDAHNIPLVSLNPTQKKSIISDPEQVFSWLYYASYATYTVDGNTPRYADDKRIYFAPQGIARDDETGDFYVSFNIGDVTNASNHGGPQRISFAGVPNEWTNLVPIIKFSSSGEPKGVEYVVGGTHEGFLTFYKNPSDNKKYLFVGGYDDGIGTRRGDTKPSGYLDEWDAYYFGSKNTSYYYFQVDNLFTSNNRNSNQLLHSSAYGGTGVVMSKLFDSDFFGATFNSEIQFDPWAGIVKLNMPDNNNIFRVKPLIVPTSKELVSYLSVLDNKQGSSNTYQSMSLRGGHIFTILGTSTKYPELRVSIVNKGNFSQNQSLFEGKNLPLASIPKYYELEGCWVNKEETELYFINKYYNSTDNQTSELQVFKVNLNW